MTLSFLNPLISTLSSTILQAYYNQWSHQNHPDKQFLPTLLPSIFPATITKATKNIPYTNTPTNYGNINTTSTISSSPPPPHAYILNSQCESKLTSVSNGIKLPPNPLKGQGCLHRQLIWKLLGICGSLDGLERNWHLFRICDWSIKPRYILLNQLQFILSAFRLQGSEVGHWSHFYFDMLH